MFPNVSIKLLRLLGFIYVAIRTGTGVHADGARAAVSPLSMALAGGAVPAPAVRGRGVSVFPARYPDSRDIARRVRLGTLPAGAAALRRCRALFPRPIPFLLAGNGRRTALRAERGGTPYAGNTGAARIGTIAAVRMRARYRRGCVRLRAMLVRFAGMGGG